MEQSVWSVGAAEQPSTSFVPQRRRACDYATTCSTTRLPRRSIVLYRRWTSTIWIMTILRRLKNSSATWRASLIDWTKLNWSTRMLNYPDLLLYPVSLSSVSVTCRAGTETVTVQRIWPLFLAIAHGFNHYIRGRKIQITLPWFCVLRDNGITMDKKKPDTWANVLNAHATHEALYRGPSRKYWAKQQDKYKNKPTSYCLAGLQQRSN